MKRCGFCINGEVEVLIPPSWSIAHDACQVYEETWLKREKVPCPVCFGSRLVPPQFVPVSFKEV